MIHPTNTELNDLLDGARGDSGLRAHLDTCPSCRRRYQDLRHIDAALRVIPGEAAPAHFTERAMERLRRSGEPSFAWSVLRNVAPLLALGAVAMAVALAGAAGSAALPAYAPSADELASWLETAGGWLPPFVNDRALSLGVAVAAVFAAVGLFDRFVLMRLWRR